jgi:hypothetical protein
MLLWGQESNGILAKVSVNLRTRCIHGGRQATMSLIRWNGCYQSESIRAPLVVVRADSVSRRKFPPWGQNEFHIRQR